MEYTNSQILSLISEYIHSERDRLILCSRLIDGITIEKLGEMYELSPRQIKNILRRDEEIIFRHIK